MKEQIKVGLADDHSLFREGIASIIEHMQHVELVMEASNGKELLSSLADQQVDVILMDLEMDQVDGIEATEQVIQNYPEIKILVLTMHNEERMITYMMECGIHGYLVKNTQKEELETAITSVFEKGFYFNDLVSQALLSGLKKRKPSRPSFNYAASLSSREMEVLELICQELTTQEIADRLFLSHRTIEGHRKSLLDKLQVKNTVGLVIKAIREGLVVI